MSGPDSMITINAVTVLSLCPFVYLCNENVREEKLFFTWSET